LGILSVVSEKGRKAATNFASGAFLGDIVWLFLTCLFLIGASRVPALFFSVLTGACALYLFWLGHKMIVASGNSSTGTIFRHPFADGIALGLLNPKSYPVLISVFSALVLNDSFRLSLQNLPALMTFSCLGFVAGYGAMIAVAGVGPVKSLYARNVRVFSVGFGLIFIGFGIKLLSLMHV
jgi:threonine/homoserine/homoserine lactone efflux protein